jgi:hypothetical protein
MPPSPPETEPPPPKPDPNELSRDLRETVRAAKSRAGVAGAIGSVDAANIIKEARVPSGNGSSGNRPSGK